METMYGGIITLASTKYSMEYLQHQGKYAVLVDCEINKPACFAVLHRTHDITRWLQIKTSDVTAKVIKDGFLTVTTDDSVYRLELE